jgi:hypothetical protein
MEIEQSYQGSLNQAIEQQRKRLLSLGRAIIPTLTPEDVLQPNDYPALEMHPLFRYEEGVLEGLLTARAVFNAERAANAESLCLSENR